MYKEQELQLKARLSRIINELNYSSQKFEDIRDDVQKEFVSRNLSSLRAMQVLNEDLDVQTLGDSEEDIRFLFLFAFALNKSLSDKEEIKINVEEYFTKLEVEKWSNYQLEKQDENIYPIVFENVNELSENMWQTTLTAQQLHELSIANALIYNFRTQRDPKITVYGKKINVDKQKVTEITNSMLAGEQFPDQIKLNVLNKGDGVRPIYNAKNNKLILNEGCIINIIDGYHRKTANSLAIDKNPDINFKWSVIVSYMSESDAHKYMTQINKQKPIKEEYIEQMDYSKDENLVVDMIMNKGHLSELAKATKDSDDYIRLNQALTKKSILATAIAENYDEQIKTNIGKRKVADWVVEFTDYLMGIYTEDFIIKPYETKKTSLINHKNMFAGYIALSAALQDNPDWQKLLEEKIDNTDFSIDNPEWKMIGIVDKDSNKSTRNKLYKLFKEGV